MRLPQVGVHTSSASSHACRCTAHRVDDVLHRSVTVVGLHYVPERRQGSLGLLGAVSSLDFVIVRSSEDRLTAVCIMVVRPRESKVCACVCALFVRKHLHLGTPPAAPPPRLTGGWRVVLTVLGASTSMPTTPPHARATSAESPAVVRSAWVSYVATHLPCWLCTALRGPDTFFACHIPCNTRKTMVLKPSTMRASMRAMQSPTYSD
jgi:hypothetical protein